MKTLLIILVSIFLFFDGCRLFDKSAPSAPHTEYSYSTSEITSPSAGAIISKGGSMIIRWNGFKAKIITLELWKKKLYNHQVIVTGAENEGSYSWSVPLEMQASVSYQVKLINSDNPSEYIYSKVFTIK